MMTPSTSASYLQTLLLARGVDWKDITAPQLTEIMLTFFRDVPAIGLNQNRDSDMLLYQWGAYDWGHGERFEFNITRQFIDENLEDDDAISQLRFTAYFAPAKVLCDFPASNKWCDSRGDLSEFSSFIFESAAYIAVKNLKPIEVSIVWENI